jgi:hypothetical protein
MRSSPGLTYCYVATTVDTESNENVYSNDASATLPSRAVSLAWEASISRDGVGEVFTTIQHWRIVCKNHFGF